MPHVHHQHSDTAVHVEEGSHHHHDGQSHDYQDENSETEEDGLFGLLLGGHSHSSQFNEIPFFRNTSKQVNELAKSAPSVVEFSPIPFLLGKAHTATPFPPKNDSPPSRHFLVSHALRGPPILG